MNYYAVIIHRSRWNSIAGEGGSEWLEEKKAIATGFDTWDQAYAKGNALIMPAYEWSMQELQRELRAHADKGSQRFKTSIVHDISELAKDLLFWQSNGVFKSKVFKIGLNMYIEIVPYEQREWVHLSTEVWDEVEDTYIQH